jgi:uncharacterized protein YodC (DUF2158 family)
MSTTIKLASLITFLVALTVHGAAFAQSNETLSVHRSSKGHHLKSARLRVPFNAYGSVTPYSVRTQDQQWSSTVHVYAPDYYVNTRSFRGVINNNLHPDFQLGGDNWGPVGSILWGVSFAERCSLFGDINVTVNRRLRSRTVSSQQLLSRDVSPWGAQLRRVEMKRTAVAATFIGIASVLVAYPRPSDAMVAGAPWTSNTPHALRIGDRVRLRSGGPLMIVTRLPQQATVECRWFDEAGQLHDDGFAIATLQVIEAAAQWARRRAAAQLINAHPKKK